MLSVSVNYSEPAQHIGLKIEPCDLVKFIVEKEGFSLVCRRDRLISAGRLFCGCILFCLLNCFTRFLGE